MDRGELLDLDHADDGGYLGWAHASCNRSAGAARGNRLRAAAYRAAKGLPEPADPRPGRTYPEPPPGTPPPGTIDDYPPSTRSRIGEVYYRPPGGGSLAGGWWRWVDGRWVPGTGCTREW
ncbi:hypothetical protein [Streptomyces sp. NPDC057686]|uniref:hypothetical protein n=1 Tax=Streptomyces sp. NPDC057686 TaxID=3346212 RepID=UPI0036C3AACE